MRNREETRAQATASVIDQGVRDDVGVLLIGHGTRDSVGTSQFFELATLLANRLRPLAVQSALLEFQEPTIGQAWEALVSRGVQHVHVAPLLLFAAGHAKRDIPDTLIECQAKTPGILFDQARPLSRHPAMIELAQLRLASALCKSKAAADRTAVVMVGRGSHDPCTSRHAGPGGSGVASRRCRTRRNCLLRHGQSTTS